MKKFNSINEEATHILKILGKEPAFVNERINEYICHYLFYNKREDFGVCSKCGATNPLDLIWKATTEAYETEYGDAPEKMKMGSGAFICPDCFEQLQAFPYGYGRGKLTCGLRSNHWQRVGKTLYLITQLVDIDFAKDKATFKKVPRDIYIYGKDRPRHLHHTFGWYSCWTERREFKFTFEPGYMGRSRYDFDLQINDPAELLEGSYLDYAGDRYEAWCWNLKEEKAQAFYPPLDFSPPWIDCEYLGAFMELPAIEVLHKTGFDHLIEERLTDQGPKRALNWKATKLNKIFRNLNKKEIREFRDYGCALITILNYQQFKKQGMTVSIPGLKVASENYRGIDAFTERVGAENLQKSLAYLANCNGTAIEYLDYLRQCEELNEDLDDKKVRYPKDLQAAHENKTNTLQERRRQYHEQKRQAQKEQFIKRIAAAFPEGYEYHNEGLVIRPALTPEELEKEGNSMRHCVATYDTEVAIGKSFIIFIRKEEDPDKSFVTMECTPEFELVQIRAKANMDPDEETKNIANRWLEEYKTEQKKWLKEKGKEIA